jgi:chemotaxis protein methyltransferase CheR
MLDLISTNETHFFREPRQFEFLAQEVFPGWNLEAAAGKMSKQIRVWSAGCSTGEEPYSLAMLLLNYFPPSAGWTIEILASDLSTRVLDRAREGLWPIEKVSEIPSDYLKSYMLRGTGSQQGKMKAGPEISALIRFERINLNEESYPLTGRFDLLFCRNVLIYFDMESKMRVVNRLIDRLSPRGYLFLGHSESLNSLSDRVRNTIPTVYTYTDLPAGTADTFRKSATHNGRVK